MMSWILAGIDRVPELRESIVFKGGTALRKCYFGEYRYSEDLDFSAREGAPRGDGLERLMSQAAHIAVSLVNEAETGENRPFGIECRRYTEKRPHPSQEAFKLRTRLPWQRRPMRPVKVEVTFGELILAAPERRSVIHPYEEPLDAAVNVYALAEITAEKLHAILDKTRQLGAAPGTGPARGTTTTCGAYSLIPRPAWIGPDSTRFCAASSTIAARSRIPAWTTSSIPA